MVGLIDGATLVVEGLGNQFQHATGVSRVRLPRHIGIDGAIRPFTASSAFGSMRLRTAHRSRKEEAEFYQAHFQLPGENAILVISNRSILFVRPSSNNIRWRVELANVQRCEGRDATLNVIVVARQPTHASLRSVYSMPQTVRLFCSDSQTRERIQTAIDDVCARWQKEAATLSDAEEGSHVLDDLAF